MSSSSPSIDDKVVEKDDDNISDEITMRRLESRLLPKLNASLTETLRTMFKEERERDELFQKKMQEQSNSTVPYGEDVNHTEKEDDVLPVSVASSIGVEPYRSPLSSLATSSRGSKRSHQDDGMQSPTQCITGMVNPAYNTGVIRDKMNTGVICDKLNTGVIRDTINTGVIRGNNEQSTFDIGEEILKQCEIDTEFYEDYNPNINTGLAERVVKYFDKGALHSEPRKLLFPKYKPPANLSVLDTPKINPGITNLPSLHTFAKNNEAKLYDVHQNLTRATMAVVNIAESALNDERNSLVVDTTMVVKNCLEAIALLGHKTWP